MFAEAVYDQDGCAYTKRPTGYEIGNKAVQLCWTNDTITSAHRDAVAISVTAYMPQVPKGTPTSEYDVVLGCHSDTPSDYLFTMSRDGHYELFRRANGNKGQSTLVDRALDGFDLSREQHRLRLECLPEAGKLRLTVYIDGNKYADEVDDAPIAAGRTFFGVSHTVKGHPVAVQFTDLAIEEPGS